jgi:hypothetical protein
MIPLALIQEVIVGRLFRMHQFWLHDPHSDRNPLRLTASQPYPLHLILRKTFLRPVVELGGAWTLVRGHGLRMLQCATIGKVRRDRGCAKTVVTDRPP